MWELTGENTKPSYNELINTTISGVFLGEVVYRLSSSILDDRKTGGARVFREIVAGVLAPVRGINRIIQGKVSRVVNKEIYQKEPLFLSVSAGAREPDNGIFSAMMQLHFTYGDPFEVRSRKPFDYFKLRADLNFGKNRHLANSVAGDGLLFGRNNDSTHKMKTLIGGFKHYDYWNTDSFEIGAIGLGIGALTRLTMKKGFFENTLHLSLVPLGANYENKIPAPDTAVNPNFKNYTYSGGAELKYLTAFNFNWGELSAEYKRS